MDVYNAKLTKFCISLENFEEFEFHLTMNFQCPSYFGWPEVKLTLAKFDIEDNDEIVFSKDNLRLLPQFLLKIFDGKIFDEIVGQYCRLLIENGKIIGLQHILFDEVLMLKGE